jgi:hypothetical protein
MYNQSIQIFETVIYIIWIIFVCYILFVYKYDNLYYKKIWGIILLICSCLFIIAANRAFFNINNTPNKIYIVFKINKTEQEKSIIFKLNKQNKLELPSIDYEKFSDINTYFTYLFAKHYEDYNPESIIKIIGDIHVYYIYLNTKKLLLDASYRLKHKIRYEDINDLDPRNIENQSYDILYNNKEFIEY